jgi:hypothetical protein
VFSGPGYREAVIELLAVVGYGEVSAFARLAEDAALAPTLADKVTLSRFAAQQLARVEPIQKRLEELGADAFAAMEEFREDFESFHTHTAPSDWWEGLVKAYVGDGLATDFYREIASFLDPRTRDLVLTVLEDGGEAEFVVDRVRAGIQADPRLGGRLALWGRRLMGEALTEGQRVAAGHEALSALLAGGTGMPDFDLTAVGAMFARLTERHAERMTGLGLAY